MTREVRRFQISVGTLRKLAMPWGSKIRHVDVSFSPNEPYEPYRPVQFVAIWAEVDMSQPLIERNFQAFASWMPIVNPLMMFVGSCYSQESSSAWHVYELSN